MITISRTFEWDMGHRVTNHDSQCRNLHGHRYKMEVSIGGKLIDEAGSSQEGMILDFGKLKSVVNDTVVDVLDHSFAYWDKDTIISNLAEANKDLKFVKLATVPTVECLVEYIASLIKDELSKQLPEISLTEIVLYETPKCYATWTSK
jgi:6-pyruvoyltetrahydropterin/6-carboxytetrahydropterin synthase